MPDQPPKLEVGQKLILECRRTVYDVEVTKVGRKYAGIVGVTERYLIDDLRVDLTSMEVTTPNGRGWGRCYLDEAHRAAVKEEERRRQEDFEAWEAFRKALPWQKPAPATAATIRQAASILGIELPGAAAEGKGADHA